MIVEIVGYSVKMESFQLDKPLPDWGSISVSASDKLVLVRLEDIGLMYLRKMASLAWDICTQTWELVQYFNSFVSILCQDLYDLRVDHPLCLPKPHNRFHLLCFCCVLIILSFLHESWPVVHPVCIPKPELLVFLCKFVLRICSFFMILALAVCVDMPHVLIRP